jgi:hypothetical protein
MPGSYEGLRRIPARCAADVGSWRYRRTIAERRRHRSRRAAAVAVAVAVAWVALPASLAAGAFSLSSNATASFSATITGADLTPTYMEALTVTDTRTTPTAGWNLTITSTTLTTGVHALSTTASKVTSVAVGTCTSGACVAPVNSIAFPVTVPAASVAPTAVKFYDTSAAHGEGVYPVTPTVQVSMPGNSFAGSYSSTLTISLVSGP